MIEELEQLTGYKIVLYTNPLAYLQHMKKVFGERTYKLTDSGYPQFIATGWCSHRLREIVVLKVFGWKKVLAHEVGHAMGLGHTMERNEIMHPWGVCRGWNGADVFLPPEILKELKK